MALTDIWVKDKFTGDMHAVGTDRHDSIWVDSSGTVHYYNLQTGDGCGYRSRMISKEVAGYEFVPSDCGQLLSWVSKPEAHGRLIDADALIKSLEVDPVECPGCPEPEYLQEFIELLNGAPTIAEAEEKE